MFLFLFLSIDISHNNSFRLINLKIMLSTLTFNTLLYEKIYLHHFIHVHLSIFTEFYST